MSRRYSLAGHAFVFSIAYGRFTDGRQDTRVRPVDGIFLITHANERTNEQTLLTENLYEVKRFSSIVHPLENAASMVQHSSTDI